MNSKTKTMLGAAFCCILWGSTFPMIKIGYKYLGIAGTDTMGIIEPCIEPKVTLVEDISSFFGA